MAQPDTRSEGNPLQRLVRYIFGLGYDRNIGGPERAIRYTLGILFAAGGFAMLARPMLAGAINAVVAAVLVAGGAYLVYEAQVQYCPLNHTLERSTYRD